MAILIASTFCSVLSCVNRKALFKQEVEKIHGLFPYFEKIKLRTFRHQDWCKCISYKKGTYTTEMGTNCTYIVDQRAVPVTEEVNGDITNLQHRLEKIGTKVFMITGVKYGESGKIIFGTFEFGSGISRRYYVYDPGYRLPEDIPRERIHTAIDRDWYHKWIDWN